MAFHDYTRRDLYNVSTERLIRSELKIVKPFWFWQKHCWVYEYAIYECVGEHHHYMGWFSFIEKEFTGWSKRFNSVKEAEQYIT
jgi:hypothetical protein